MAATLISSAIPFEAPIARKRSFPVPEEPVAWPVERVTYKALRELCSVRGPWLTITGPAHRRGAANGEACVFIADILRDARAALAASPFSLFAERWIAPLEGLAEQWRGSESGFMWFISPYPEASGATVRAFEWQGGEIPRVVFSTYPEIAPLLEASSIPHEFFVLGLSRKQLAVFACKDGACTEIEPPADLPVKLGEIEKIEHACADRHRIARREQHLWARVAAGFRRKFGDAKVVLIGVEAERRSFRAAAGTDLHIIGEVAGSPDGLPISQVEKKALAAVAAGHASAAESLFENDREADRIAPLIDVRQICDAAIEGRVHRLYVRVATQFLGRLDPAVTSVTGDEDLISAAVASALRTGGDVIPVPAKSMNLGTPLAAVLRY